MIRPSRLAGLALVLAPLLIGSGGQAIAATSRVKLEPVLAGYSRPVLVTHAPGAGRRLFIVEQTGRIKVAERTDGTWRKAGTFLDLRSLAHDPREEDRPEQGLLGLAFHPNYAKNGRFYVNYTRRGVGDEDDDIVVAEYRRETATRADPGSGRIVLVIPASSRYHNGGHLAFGPDGRLYISVGDGGGQGDPGENGQDLGVLKGKILRIAPSDPDGDGPDSYRIPLGNPYVGTDGRDEIWASGLRNPWRFSFDRRRGHLWIGDVGQYTREEVDKALAGASGTGAGRGDDYGWDDCEGTLEFEADEGDPDDLCSHDVLPIHDYPHAGGWCAVTGGFVHRGPTAPEWRGLYVAGDWCGGLFVLDAKGQRRLTKTTDHQFTSFGEDAAGNIYATAGADVYRLRFLGPRP